MKGDGLNAEKNIFWISETHLSPESGSKMQDLPKRIKGEQQAILVLRFLHPADRTKFLLEPSTSEN